MKRTIKLIWQLYPSYLIITLIALGAVSWYSARYLSDYFYQRTFNDLKAQGHIVELQVAPYLDPLDAGAIDSLCKQIGRTVSTRVTVILPDGIVIGDSEEEPQHMDNHIERPEVRQALDGHIGSSQRYSRTLGKHMMYVAMPLGDDSELRGILRTSMALTDVDTELGRIQDRIIMGGLLIAVFAAAVCYYISRRISLPMEKLRQGAENFARGNLAHRLPLPRTRETAGLARAMNEMAARLEQRIEAEINQRNEMEAILASMSEGVIAIDTEAHILSYNQAAADIVQGLKKSTPGQWLQEVIRNRQLQNFINRAREEHELVAEDIPLNQPNQRIVNVHATPIRNSRQERMGTLLVFTDVTQLRHLEKMRRDFVANVSHEIKTPLTAIKGFVETLRSGAKDRPEEADRFIAIIAKHADRLEAIIEDLLQLSRIETRSEAREIELQVGPIDKILRSAIQLCRAKAAAKEIEIIPSGEERLTAPMNAPLLEQALINLIDNAIKYSNAGSRIDIIAEQTPDELAIHIADNGIGIPQKDIPRLFERFYRVDKARSREQGGTGLGLAIVKHIMRAHGGKVTVASKQGQGSAFTIHLPRSGRSPAPPVTRPEADDSPPT